MFGWRHWDPFVRLVKLIQRNLPGEKPAYILCLPPELLIEVLSLVHDPDHPRDTLSASLVCQAWCTAAQTVLYSNVRIPLLFSARGSHRVDTPFLSALVHRPRRPNYARWEEFYDRRTRAPVEAKIWGPSVLEVPGPLPPDARAFGWLDQGSPELRYCEGVRRLQLSCVPFSLGFLNASGLRGEPHAYLKSTPTDRPASTDLEHLEVHGDDRIQLERIDDFRAQTYPPSLSSLIISGDAAFLERILGMWQHWAPLTFVEIRLRATPQVTTAALQSLVDLLLALKESSTDFTTYSRHLAVVLIGPGADDSRIDDHARYAPLLAALPTLTHLTLDFGCVFRDETTPSCLGALPPSLQRLTVRP